MRKMFHPQRAQPSQRAQRVDWFTVRRGRLEYRGRITRQPFAAWCATREGEQAIARVAKGIRFSIVGRKRSARRRLWRDLDAASRTDAFRSAISAEPNHFMQAMADVCYAGALPRAQVAVRRLVLAPRALVAGRARAAVFARLMESPALAGIDEAVRKFVLDQLVIELDAAIKRASPAPRRPVVARDGWACVGVRLGTVWMDPLWAGPDGTGHLFMYEMPPQGLTRRDLKALDAAIEQMSGAVSTLSRGARDELVRSAAIRPA
jgi:hypothetical protein